MNRRRFLSACAGALLSVTLPLQELLAPLADREAEIRSHIQASIDKVLLAMAEEINKIVFDPNPLLEHFRGLGEIIKQEPSADTVIWAGPNLRRAAREQA